MSKGMRSCAQGARGVKRSSPNSLFELNIWQGLFVGLLGCGLLLPVSTFALTLPAQYKSVTPYTPFEVSTYLTNIEACQQDALRYTGVSGPYYLGNSAAALTTCFGTNNSTNWITLFGVSANKYCPAATGWKISGEYPSHFCTGACPANTTLISDGAGYTCAVPPPKDNGPPPFDLCTSNPVHTATGNKFQRETDLAWFAVADTAFSRYYNSRSRIRVSPVECRSACT